MATPDEIAALRLLVAEPTEEFYTEAELGARLDAAASASQLARDIWIEKAARYASIVDISEGGSSRSAGSMYANAMKMVELFDRLIVSATPVDPATTGVVVGRLRRTGG